MIVSESSAPESHRTVQYRAVGGQEQGQRIDNYLTRILKGVPKSRIYRAVRSGEVRVNGSRVKVSCRLHVGDQVRIPPLRTSKGSAKAAIPSSQKDRIAVLYEDRELLIVDKPSGLAVHGGTGIAFGLIEVLREFADSGSFLELVHRLDRETSGCLMLAKTRTMLLRLHQKLSEGREIRKRYVALVKGSLKPDRQDIRLSLAKKSKQNDHRIKVGKDGQYARSIVTVMRRFESASLVNIDLITGRMHQARVHCAASGFPIAGDRIYGDLEFNRKMGRYGLDRLFLHAQQLELDRYSESNNLKVTAPMPEVLQTVIDNLKN